MSKLLAVLLLVSGCSVALQKRPTSQSGVAQSGDCTSGPTFWIADAVGVGVGAVAAGVGTGLAIMERDGKEEVGWMIAAGGAATALVYYASMGNGRKWAAECAAHETMPVAAR